MEELSVEELNTPEGRYIIRLITDRKLQNEWNIVLDDFHPEDAEYHLKTTYEVMRAFIELGDELGW